MGVTVSERRSAKFISCQSGNVAILAGFLIPILVAAIGGTFDYASMLRQKAKLQTLADAAAIAAGRELTLAGSDDDRVEAVVKDFVAAQLNSPHSLTIDVDDDALRVRVDLSAPAKSYFGADFGLAAIVSHVEVTSISEVVGQPNVCILALNSSDGEAVSLETVSRITANNCSVFSNSTHVESISSTDSAQLRASLICSAGGKEGSESNFNPQPILDCPTFDDPLASRPEPSSATCTFNSTVEVNFDQTLAPGVYCGGIIVSGSAIATLSPGVYVIKDGPLLVNDMAQLIGQEVGFYFTGTGVDMLFDDSATVNLTAPTSGSMAGLLLYGSRTLTPSSFKVFSNNARTLVGTIYLPTGELYVETKEPVADQSAYTAIVADSVTLIGEPHLVLNTDYHLTSVPVPDGIKGVGEPVVLRQ